MVTAPEVHWLVITSDGRHSTIGSRTDPTDEEVTALADQLSSSGLAGWLAVMRGSYYAAGDIELLMVRPLGAMTGALWSEAVDAFLELRLQET